MKILIAVLSCRAHAAFQQAQRETWVKDIPEGVDFKYFVGYETTEPDEVQLGGDAFKPEQGLKKYPSLPDKTKRLCQWALDYGYDYLFKTDTDTVINVKNLLNSGFKKWDYSGGYNQEETGEFCSGGAGYWLSRKAMQIVSDSTFTSWAEDLFVAGSLKQAGILPVFDPGYRWKPGEVIDSEAITLHLGSALHPKKYEPGMMYEHYTKIMAVNLGYK